MPLRVTVAICTWNRCQLLGRTLERMTSLRIPPSVEWELLVVNNRSSDATDEVIESFQGRLPIRRAWEPLPGLANARNCAVSEAQGEYIVWTDDDVLVDEDWLAAYCRAFRRWPEADLFGGPIEPLFEGKPPAWIHRVLSQVGPVFGLQTLGERPVALSAERVSEGPYGGNMAMRRATQLRFRFDPRFGVRHGVYGIGEETEIMRQILSAGGTGWWTPEPRVQHWVPRSSQTVAYVRRWMVGCGRYMAIVPERDRSLPQNDPYRLLARYLRHEIAFCLRRLISPPERWIRDLIRADQARGRLLATRQERTSGGEP